MSSKAKEKFDHMTDSLIGPGTGDKVEGKSKELMGNAKQAVGRMANDPCLVQSGKTEEAEGKAQQVAGAVKNAAHSVATAVEKVAKSVKHAGN